MSKRKFNIDEIKKNWETNKKSISRKIGTIAVNHFKNSFRTGGFTDNSLSKWRPRKNNFEPSRAVLVKSGDLRRSIRIKSNNGNRVVIGTTGVNYARVHNEGGKFIPKRQFIGDSKVMNNKIVRKLARELGNLI